MAGTITHLTPEERRRYAEEQMRARQAAKNEKLHRRFVEKQDRINKNKAKLAKVIQVDPPPVPLAEMYGQPQTTLPATVRTVDVPYDHTVPVDITPDPFIEEIAVQPGFMDTIETLKDERVARFLKLVGQTKNRSMTWCAKAVGLTNTELAKVWCDSNNRQAFFRIVKRFPQVADKVVDDALGVQKSCPRCDGLCRIDVPERYREFFNGQDTAICPNCDGRGTVATMSQPQAVERIWERMGWAKKDQGISVNINMQDHSVDATIGEMDKIEADILEHRA